MDSPLRVRSAFWLLARCLAFADCRRIAQLSLENHNFLRSCWDISPADQRILISIAFRNALSFAPAVCLRYQHQRPAL